MILKFIQSPLFSDPFSDLVFPDFSFGDGDYLLLFPILLWKTISKTLHSIGSHLIFPSVCHFMPFSFMSWPGSSFHCCDIKLTQSSGLFIPKFLILLTRYSYPCPFFQLSNFSYLPLVPGLNLNLNSAKCSTWNIISTQQMVALVTIISSHC